MIYKNKVKYKVKAFTDSEPYDWGDKIDKRNFRSIDIGVKNGDIKGTNYSIISQETPDLFLNEEAKKYLKVLIENLPNEKHFSKHNIYIVKEEQAKNVRYVNVVFHSSFRQVQATKSIVIYRDVTAYDNWEGGDSYYCEKGTQGVVKRSNFKIIYNRETGKVKFLAEKFVRKKSICVDKEEDFRLMCDTELRLFNKSNLLPASGMYIDKRSRGKKLCHYLFMPDLGLEIDYFMPNTKESSFYEINIAERLRIVVLFLKKLKQLHEAGYVHGDIHEGNVLYNPYTRNVSLCDFGSSHKIGELDNSIKEDYCYDTYYDIYLAAAVISDFIAGKIESKPINSILEHILRNNPYSEKVPSINIDKIISVFKKEYFATREYKFV